METQNMWMRNHLDSVEKKGNLLVYLFCTKKVIFIFRVFLHTVEFLPGHAKKTPTIVFFFFCLLMFSYSQWANVRHKNICYGWTIHNFLRGYSRKVLLIQHRQELVRKQKYEFYVEQVHSSNFLKSTTEVHLLIPLLRTDTSFVDFVLKVF